MAATNPPHLHTWGAEAPPGSALFRQLQCSVYSNLSQGFFKKSFGFIITNKNASSSAQFFSAAAPWELKNKSPDKPAPANIIAAYF